VIELDVQRFFDTLDKSSAAERFLRRRVRDGVLLRLIGKVAETRACLEDGAVWYPRGRHAAGWGGFSPLLANIFLARSAGRVVRPGHQATAEKAELS